MTKTLLYPTLALSAVILSSCGNMNYAGLEAPSSQRDALAGASLGGIAGAVIGHQSGETRNGALIGAALGGAAGWVVGDNKDRQWESRGFQSNAPGYQPPPPRPADNFGTSPWGVPHTGGR